LTSRRRKVLVRIAIAGGVALGGLLSTVFANVWIKRSADPYVFRAVDDVPRRRVAIVPGARVYRSGRVSSVLADRLEAAVDLYRAGKVDRILASGDHAGDDYDEVNPMYRWLLDHGVRDEDIFLDHAGLRTLDTMERAKRVFLVDEAVVCTNEFHLHRSVFLARRAGIDAVGLVSDRRAYQAPVRNAVREHFARTKAFLDGYVFRPDPAHLGDPIPIDGDPAATRDAHARR
jgi:SanA protein